MANTMGKFAATVIVAGVIFIFAFLFLVNSISDNFIAKDKSMKELYVNKKIVVDKDSLTIVDVSVLFETCTLSNGSKVSKTLVDKQLFPTKTIK